MVIKILVLFGTMFLLMMIGSPIAVALGVATMVTMTATTNISLTTMSTACLSGLDSFPLMAIPFFMLAGNLMKSGGISRRILDFADAVVGWVTGSVGMVTVVVFCGSFWFISGNCDSNWRHHDPGDERGGI